MTTQNRLPPWLLAASFFCWLLCERSCLAQTSAADAARGDPATARALLNTGAELARNGRYAEACPKLEESYRLAPVVEASFALADCWEHMGRLASAWARFSETADAARAAGMTERQDAALERAAALQPRLTKLKILVIGAQPSLELSRNGSVVGRASWGIAIPVDPGRHIIRATSPGVLPWQRVVDIAVAEGGTIELSVPDLSAPPEPTPVPAPPPAPNPPPATAPPPPIAPSEPTTDRSPRAPARWRKPVGIALAAVGGVAATTGLFFALRAGSKNDEATNTCPSSFGCTASQVRNHQELLDEAATARAIGAAGLATGGALLLGGTVILVARPKPQQSAQSAPAGRGTAGLDLGLQYTRRW